MSVISDDLFANKIKQLQALKKEIDQDRLEAHKILGEWLANALDDDDNHELQAIFLDAHDNEKYVRLKKHREFLKSIAHKMQGEAKVTLSNFTPPKDSQNSKHGSLFEDDSLEQ
ncbi:MULTISPECIES: hypothetical protein [Psychrobacter]|uniref:hypothetical protein n=1 Tax=Psychrobacter TaxID=497 RepID=UPI00191886BF|nr:hypothetical protein [Psychrobacter immobilis]